MPLARAFDECAWLCDLDGTLVDSESAITRAWRRLPGDRTVASLRELMD